MLPNCCPGVYTNQKPLQHHVHSSVLIVRAVNVRLHALKGGPPAVHLPVWNQLGVFYSEFLFSFFFFFFGERYVPSFILQFLAAMISFSANLG